MPVSKDEEYKQIHIFISRLFQSREKTFQFMIALNGVLLSVASSQSDSLVFLIMISIFSVAVSSVLYGIERRTMQVLEVCVSYGKEFEINNDVNLLNKVWNSPGKRAREYFRQLYFIIILVWVGYVSWVGVNHFTTIG